MQFLRRKVSCGRSSAPRIIHPGREASGACKASSPTGGGGGRLAVPALFWMPPVAVAWRNRHRKPDIRSSCGQGGGFPKATTHVSCLESMLRAFSSKCFQYPRCLISCAWRNTHRRKPAGGSWRGTAGATRSAARRDRRARTVGDARPAVKQPPIQARLIRRTPSSMPLVQWIPDRNGILLPPGAELSATRGA